MREAKKSSRQRLYEFLILTDQRKKFDGILPDLSNIENVFDNNYRYWISKNQHDDLRDNFSLTEKDFIESELEMLKNIDQKKLRAQYDFEIRHEQFNFNVVIKKIQRYKSYLENKITTPSKEPISFAGMFRDKNDLDKIVGKLTENEFCKAEPIRWQPKLSGGNQTPNKFLTALYVSLFEKGYLKGNYNQTEASMALSNYFDFNLSKKVFGENKRSDDFQELKESYFFIPKKVN